MPPTFQDLKAKLGDWLAVDIGRLADSVRGDCINLAMRDLARLHDLWLNEVGGSGTNLLLSVGVRDYGVPSDFSRPHSIWYQSLTDLSIIVFVTQRSKEQFDALFPDDAKTGLPAFYTFWAGKLQFGPTPEATFAGHINYYAVPEDLTDALNTNLFTQFAWEAVFFRALVYASKYLIEDPRLPVWEQGARDAELKLVIENARARHSGGPLVIEEPG